MGRHKDPDTLHFIEWLRKKGKDLGYYAEIECPIGHNDYYVDAAWKHHKNQIPMITFEVETTNHSGIFRNTMKIFGTRQLHVKKPFHHFMIVLKSSLTKGQRASLHLFRNHFNTSLYENIYNEPDKCRELENELENLASNRTREEEPLLSLFRSSILFDISDIEYAFSKFGQDLPFLLKDDFIPLDEKHTYKKGSKMIGYLRNRLHEIRFIKDIKEEDFQIFLELTKLAERIDAKESYLLSQGICPKCGSRLIQKQICHGVTQDDPEPYAVTYIDGCEPCDYELNRETIDL